MCAESTRPELKDLFKYVTPRYASYWKEIGIFLDFKPEQLEIIKMDNPADAKRSCNEMFIRWLKADPNASWEKFFNALDLATGAANNGECPTDGINKHSNYSSYKL